MLKFKYEIRKNIKTKTEFRRLTGIKRKTFNTMLEVLKKEKENHIKTI